MARNFIILITMLGLAGCAALFGPSPRQYNETDFRNFLNNVKVEAMQKGISQKTLAENLDNAEYLPKVIELDYRQRAKFVPFQEYITSTLTQRRIDDANRLYPENQPLLSDIANKYGVDSKVIVALWGMESNFGNYQGNFHVVSALATLSYDGKRGDFFKTELIDSLQIIDQGNISGDDMKGSWAGAMGQSQFMPSTFLTYAVDEDRDGRKDIWNDKADVFGSIANYLHNLGWKKDDGICQKISLPSNFDLSQADIKNIQPVSYWLAKGIEIPGKTDGNKPSSIINLEGDDPNIEHDGNYYIVYDNYRKIMKWNHSLYFATSICLLADSIE